MVDTFDRSRAAPNIAGGSAASKLFDSDMIGAAGHLQISVKQRFWPKNGIT